jgi:hypothetical protein
MVVRKCHVPLQDKENKYINTSIHRHRHRHPNMHKQINEYIISNVHVQCFIYSCCPNPVPGTTQIPVCSNNAKQ